MSNRKIEEIPKDDETGRILHDEMTDEYTTRFVYIDENKTVLPVHYQKYADDIENLEVKNDDVWVCSYPKTGTTWSQEMVWLIAYDLDYESAKVELNVRFPFLELCTLANFEKIEQVVGVKVPLAISDSVQFINEHKSPRFIKSHMPFPLLPRELRSGLKTPKIVYVMRNPKDTCVSYYHHSRIFQGCRSSLEDFAKVFLADQAMWGSYWKHILGFWEQRDRQNLLIIKYEDMKKDLPAIIKKVASFFGKTFSEEQIDKLAKHLSFESMKNNPFVNSDDHIALRRKYGLTVGDGSFIRSGRVGSHKDELSGETIEKFDVWTKNSLNGTNFCEY